MVWKTNTLGIGDNGRPLQRAKRILCACFANFVSIFGTLRYPKKAHGQKADKQTNLLVFSRSQIALIFFA